MLMASIVLGAVTRSSVLACQGLALPWRLCKVTCQACQAGLQWDERRDDLLLSIMPGGRVSDCNVAAGGVCAGFDQQHRDDVCLIVCLAHKKGRHGCCTLCTVQHEPNFQAHRLYTRAGCWLVAAQS